MCICNASIVNCKSPEDTIDISKVTIPYPTLAGSSKIWEQTIRAEETLVAATLLLVALVKGFNSETAAQSLHDNIRIMDDVIVHLLHDSGQDGDHRTPRVEGSESRLTDCFRTTARIRLNSARIKLHRYRAMMDNLRILSRFDTNHRSRLSTSDGALECATSLDAAKAARIFPFSAAQSKAVCQQSASNIVHGLNQLLNSGSALTPCFCSGLLAGYTLMMISHFDSSAHAEGTHDGVSQETRKRLADGVKTAIRVLAHFSRGFGAVAALKDQLEIAAIACDLAEGGSYNTGAA
ncbi:hypothetical protein CGCS363_v001592 [Colletotrichum siamense]|uniref:uncharacterized protein n=1 Tax=Colletotrichum siamense TaxID=690259 RepID=UPI001872A13E|nr:uncharacterized protein CGCS363_v001592 [Colletotrichum siamense]KAF5515563.1 hypothetical protein CGCS363_v001592 [Colletotrichum siamense]